MPQLPWCFCYVYLLSFCRLKFWIMNWNCFAIAVCLQYITGYMRFPFFSCLQPACRCGEYSDLTCFLASQFKNGQKTVCTEAPKSFSEADLHKTNTTCSLRLIYFSIVSTAVNSYFRWPKLGRNSENFEFTWRCGRSDFVLVHCWVSRQIKAF